MDPTDSVYWMPAAMIAALMITGVVAFVARPQNVWGMVLLPVWLVVSLMYVPKVVVAVLNSRVLVEVISDDGHSGTHHR
jgi:hypothetical protein